MFCLLFHLICWRIVLKFDVCSWFWNFLPLLALSGHSEHLWEINLTDENLGLGFSIFGSLARFSSFCRDMMHPDLEKRKSFIFFVSWKFSPHFPKNGSSWSNLDAPELKISICLPLQLFIHILIVRLGSLFLGKSSPNFPKNGASGSNLDAPELNISIVYLCSCLFTF